MVQWVSEQVHKATLITEVVIATDDIEVGNFKLILVITDNLLGNRKYRNSKIYYYSYYCGNHKR